MKGEEYNAGNEEIAAKCNAKMKRLNRWAYFLIALAACWRYCSIISGSSPAALRTHPPAKALLASKIGLSPMGTKRSLLGSQKIFYKSFCHGEGVRVCIRLGNSHRVNLGRSLKS
jgi:hypothetical protein